MVIECLIIFKGIPIMNKNEIKKHIKITKELNDMLQEAVRVTGTTETSLIKVALFEYLKGIKLWVTYKIELMMRLITLY